MVILTWIGHAQPQTDPTAFNEKSKYINLNENKDHAINFGFRLLAISILL